MNSTLKMLLPTTLPSAMPTWPPPCRTHRDGEFRRAGAEGHDRQAKYQRRNAKRQSKLRGATNQDLGPEDERDQAEDENQCGQLSFSLTAV
jgi:ribosomal protein L44E